MDKLKQILALPSITIKVKPNSPKTEIIEIKNNILKVAVKAPAEQNKANIELIKFFSKLTNKKVKIIKGLTSKLKILRFC